MGSRAGIERARLLYRGELLEAATVAWNVVEGIVAVVAGVLASSVALVGFGVDSFVETASGAWDGGSMRNSAVMPMKNVPRPWSVGPGASREHSYLASRPTSSLTLVGGFSATG